MMTDELTYTEVLDKLPAYALGALEPEEMLAVDAYIKKHEQLLTQLHESEQAAVQLAYLAPTTPLPPEVKDQLLQRVQADLKEKQLDQADQADAVPAAGLEAAIQPPPQPEPEQISPPAARPNRLAALQSAFNLRSGWAWATLLLLVVLVIVSLYAYQVVAQLRQRLQLAEANRTVLQAGLSQQETENNRIRSQRDQFETERKELRAEVAQLEQQNEQQQAQLDEAEAGRAQIQAELDQLQEENAQLVVDNETLQQISQDLAQQVQAAQGRLQWLLTSSPVLIPGTQQAPDAWGLLYPGANQALLLLHGLEPLPPEQTYQLWLISEDGVPAPAGFVAVEAQRPALLLVPFSVQAEASTALGVSVEPSGGSQAPTGPILLLGDLS
jgi:anti-sigma-K factor RskA